MLFNDEDETVWLYGFKTDRVLRFNRPLPLAEIYAAAREDRINVGLDLVMDGIDRLLSEGEVAKVNLLLRDMNVARLGSTIAVGVLTATLLVKQQLRSRPDFLTRTVRQLLSEGHSRRDARSILRGLQ